MKTLWFGRKRIVDFHKNTNWSPIQNSKPLKVYEWFFTQSLAIGVLYEQLYIYRFYLYICVMAIRPTTQAFYKAIRIEYSVMVADGRYRTDFIISELAKKYYRSTATIERIVYTK